MELMQLVFQTISEKLNSIELKLDNLQIENQPKEETPVSGKDLCNYLGISHPTLISRRKKGQIPYLKVGKRFLYLKSDVIAKISKLS
jgi:hypothetical protein